MTTLEIKRIDSVRSSSGSSSTPGLNNNNVSSQILGSPTSNSSYQKNNRYSLQQQNGYINTNHHQSPSKTLTKPSSPTSNSANDQLPDVVPITIVKSPSYTNQLTSLAQVYR